MIDCLAHQFLKSTNPRERGMRNAHEMIGKTSWKGVFKSHDPHMEWLSG